jgi:hypothetical protein
MTAGANRRQRFSLGLFLGIPALALLGCCGGGCFGLRWFAHESGRYRSPNGVAVTNAARDAYLTAIQSRPQGVLLLEEHRGFEYTVTFLPNGAALQRGQKQIVERDVDIILNDGINPNLPLLRPAINHDGRADKMDGYRLILHGGESTSGRMPGPGRP